LAYAVLKFMLSSVIAMSADSVVYFYVCLPVIHTSSTSVEMLDFEWHSLM
jgi:hypothetical protein